MSCSLGFTGMVSPCPFTTLTVSFEQSYLIHILLAWLVVDFITISLGTWLVRRKSVNQHNKEIGENEMTAQARSDFIG